MRVGIVGFGREGKWWSKFFQGQGYAVMTSNNDTEAQIMIPQVNIIVLCVPMSVAGYMARVITSMLNPHQLVISACGVMVPVDEVLKSRDDINAIILHRMIGPQVETMKGHPLHVYEVAVCDKWRQLVDDLVRNLDGITLRTEPKKHDWSVGFTQAMIRIMSLSIAKITLENPDLISNFGNVPFDGSMLVVKRIFDFDPDLSYDMIHSNSFAQEWIIKMHDTMKYIETLSREDFHILWKEFHELIGKSQIQAGSLALVRVVESTKYLSQTLQSV